MRVEVPLTVSFAQIRSIEVYSLWQSQMRARWRAAIRIHANGVCQVEGADDVHTAGSTPLSGSLSDFKTIRQGEDEVAKREDHDAERSLLMGIARLQVVVSFASLLACSAIESKALITVQNVTVAMLRT